MVGWTDRWMVSYSPAGVNGAHGGWRQVGVVLNGDCLLHVVLADVLIHLLHSQWLPVLGNTPTSGSSDSVASRIQPSTTYFIVAEEPEPRRLVVFIVGDVQVVGSGLEDGILTAQVCFGFHHFTGVQGGLDVGDR